MTHLEVCGPLVVKALVSVHFCFAQILPRFVGDVLNFPGIQGVLLAALASGSLRSVLVYIDTFRYITHLYIQIYVFLKVLHDAPTHGKMNETLSAWLTSVRRPCLH